MSNKWSCNNCEDNFIARELYPVQYIDDNLEIHNYLLCKSCLAESTLAVDYLDELEEIERLRYL